MEYISQNTPVSRLFRAVSRRLWFATAVRAAVTALWIFAVVLVCGGLAHIFIHAHDWRAVGIPMAMLAGAGIATALWRQKPTRDLAARTADNWFHGKSLMTTVFAFDTRATSEPGESSLFVWREANTCAEHWLKRIRSEYPVRLPRHTWKVLLPILAGTILYSLPGARSSSAPEPTSAESASSAAPRVESPTASLAEQIERALHESATRQREREFVHDLPDAPAPIAPDRPRDESAMKSPPAHDQRAGAARQTSNDVAATDATRESFATETGPGAAAPTGGTGDAAGETPGTPKYGGARSRAPTGDDHPQYEGIPATHANDRSARMHRDRASAVEGDIPHAAGAPAARDAESVKLEKSAAYRTVLPLAYREYVANYLTGAPGKP